MAQQFFEAKAAIHADIAARLAKFKHLHSHLFPAMQSALSGLTTVASSAGSFQATCQNFNTGFDKAVDVLLRSKCQLCMDICKLAFARGC